MKKVFFVSLFLNSLLFAETLNKVTLQLKWKHQFQFAGYYAALHKGYYKEVGLDVIIKEATSKTKIDVVNEVLNKNADFGIGMSNLLLEYAKNKPIVVLGVVFQHSPYSIMSLTQKINTIHDLIGKKVMIEEVAVDIFAHLRREKIDTKKLEIIEHIHNPDDLLNGTIDAMSVYNCNEPYFLRKKNISYNLFSPREAGIDFYGDNIFTTKEMIDKNPDIVNAFKKASFKGWQYALSNQEEIIDLILKEYNTQNKKREYYEFEAMKLSELIHPDLVEIGYMHKGRWEHIVNIYKELGFLSEELNLDNFLFTPNESIWEKYKTIFYFLIILFLILLLSWYFVYILKLKVKKEVAKNIEQSKKLAMSNMVANISHQWKEPLLQISTLNHILIHTLSTSKGVLKKEEVLIKLLEIDKSIVFMSDTMQTFLQFYKDEHKEERFDIKTSIEEAIHLLENRIKKDNLNIVFYSNKDILLFTNKNQIMQVWLNFINNILNAIEKNNLTTPKLMIFINKGEIIFEDNCGGIKDIESLFSEKNKGLGLKMCKEILERNGFSFKLKNTNQGLKISCNYNLY